jgi:hypothetical protein
MREPLLSKLVRDAMPAIKEMGRAAICDRLQLKWLPTDTVDGVREIESFLQLLDCDQTDLIQAADNEQAEWYIEILTSRAMYVSPVDRDPGSITQDKVDAYPDRYRWEPGK